MVLSTEAVKSQKMYRSCVHTPASVWYENELEITKYKKAKFKILGPLP